FGLGAESVQYTETTRNISATSPRMTNLMQRSIGYTPIGKRAGFYLRTLSTITTGTTTETWSMAPFGTVQSNKRKVKLVDLGLIGSWLVGHGVQVLGGLNINTMNFSRSAFAYPQGTQGTLTRNNAGNIVFTPTSLGDLQQLSSGGSTRYLVRQRGAIYEDQTNVVLNLGLRFDSLFLDRHAPFRFAVGGTVGVPVLYSVYNSNFPDSKWQEYFRGYDISAEIGAGVNFAKDFELMVFVTGDYRYRPETARDPATGGFVPKNTTSIVRISGNLSWHF
ncbi:MAG: hypothetical protein D6743_11245, partial [Calditrichaeota bacterium]